MKNLKWISLTIFLASITFIELFASRHERSLSVAVQQKKEEELQDLDEILKELQLSNSSKRKTKKKTATTTRKQEEEIRDNLRTLSDLARELSPKKQRKKDSDADDEHSSGITITPTPSRTGSSEIIQGSTSSGSFVFKNEKEDEEKDSSDDEENLARENNENWLGEIKVVPSKTASELSETADNLFNFIAPHTSTNLSSDVLEKTQGIFRAISNQNHDVPVSQQNATQVFEIMNCIHGNNQTAQNKKDRDEIIRTMLLINNTPSGKEAKKALKIWMMYTNNKYKTLFSPLLEKIAEGPQETARNLIKMFIAPEELEEVEKQLNSSKESTRRNSDVGTDATKEALLTLLLQQQINLAQSPAHSRRGSRLPHKSPHGSMVHHGKDDDNDGSDEDVQSYEYDAEAHTQSHARKKSTFVTLVTIVGTLLNTAITTAGVIVAARLSGK